MATLLVLLIGMNVRVVYGIGDCDVKQKGLFDAVPETVDSDPTAEPVHFAEYRERMGPIRAWVAGRFGPCGHLDSWRHLRVTVAGVTVAATLYETHFEWHLGFGGDTRRCGYSKYDGWEAAVPSAIRLAAEYVRLRVGGGL